MVERFQDYADTHQYCLSDWFVMYYKTILSIEVINELK